VETILYDRNGEAKAYITSDFHNTIYLWDGLAAAYLHEEEHIYGFNGRHLGWFKNDVLFNYRGERVGFTHTTCPVGIAKPPVKEKKLPLDELKPRSGAPALPKLAYHTAQEGLTEFLRQGLVTRYSREVPAGEPGA